MATVRKVKRSPVKAALKQKLAALPSEPKSKDDNLLHYLFLIYGRPKIGKTTICASWPGALFLPTEAGTKALEVYQFTLDGKPCLNSWEEFVQGVDALVEDGCNKFQTVIIDTADRAYDMCLEHVCEDRGVPSPSAAEDYGDTWRAIRDEFDRQVTRLTQIGYGIVFTSHAQERTVKEGRGKHAPTYDQVTPTLSGQARKVIESLVDFFFFCDYIQDHNLMTRRVIVCEGNEAIWAGAREGLGGRFPSLLPMREKGCFNVIQEAFRSGQDVGLNPETLMPAKSSVKSTKGLLQDLERNQRKGGIKRRRKE